MSEFNIIIIIVLSIILVHIILFFIRDRRYIKPFKIIKDPQTISLKDLKELPVVNFIIPAWNEGETFRKALFSIKELYYPKINVVINAGGSEETVNIANSFKVHDNFKVIYQEKGGGKIKAINNCLPLIKEGLVYFIDADIYITDEVFLRMIHPIINLNEKVSMAGSRPLKDQQDKDFVKYLHINHSLSYRRIFERYGKEELSGVNSCVSYDVIKKIGKFSENRLYATDTSRGNDIRSHGFKLYNLIHYNSLIYTEIPERKKEFIKQRIRWIENSLMYSLETNIKIMIRFFLLFFSSLYILLWPLFLFFHSFFFLFGVYLILNLYLLRVRRTIFFKITRKKQHDLKFSSRYYLKILYYIYIELIVNIGTFFDFLFLKRNFKKRRNLA